MSIPWFLLWLFGRKMQTRLKVPEPKPASRRVNPNEWAKQAIKAQSGSTVGQASHALDSSEVGLKKEYYKRRDQAKNEQNGPYTVYLIEQYNSAEGGPWETCATLEEAITSARGITERAIKSSRDGVKGWKGMGDAGMVYDASGVLVWDGVIEYAPD